MNYLKFKITFSFCIAALINISISDDATAAKQYRCNGRIQYRPCLSNAVTLSLQNTQRNLAKASLKTSNKRSNGKDLYAEVIKSSYKKMARANGQWRGIVRGNGDVHLTLEIIRNGDVESRKYMGHVVLADKETNFSFISASPKGKDWTWRVTTLAR